MQPAHHRADRQPECVGGLLVGQTGDVDQSDDRLLIHRQLAQSGFHPGVEDGGEDLGVGSGGRLRLAVDAVGIVEEPGRRRRLRFTWVLRTMVKSHALGLAPSNLSTAR